MSLLCSKFLVLIDFLVGIAMSPKMDGKDRAWARDIVALMSGPDGFVRTINFAIDTDFSVATHVLVATQDHASSDVALTLSQVLTCREQCKVLFRDGSIFDEAPNSTQLSQ